MKEPFTPKFNLQRGCNLHDGYHLFYAARAELLRRIGADQEVAQSYTLALALVTNDSERRFLERRLREVQP